MLKALQPVSTVEGVLSPEWRQPSSVEEVSVPVARAVPGFVAGKPAVCYLASSMLLVVVWELWSA